MIYSLLSPGALVRKLPAEVHRLSCTECYASADNYMHQAALSALDQTVGKFECLRNPKGDKNFRGALDMATMLRERLSEPGFDVYSVCFKRLTSAASWGHFCRQIEMFKRGKVNVATTGCTFDERDTGDSEEQIKKLTNYVYSYYPWIFQDYFLRYMDQYSKQAKVDGIVEGNHLYPLNSVEWKRLEDARDRAAYVILYALGTHFVCNGSERDNWLVDTLLVLMEKMHPAFDWDDLNRIHLKDYVLKIITEQADSLYNKMLWPVSILNRRPELDSKCFTAPAFDIRAYAADVKKLYQEYEYYCALSKSRFLEPATDEQLRALLKKYKNWKTGWMQLDGAGYPRSFKRADWDGVAKDLIRLQNLACRIMPFCLMARVAKNLPDV